MGQQLELVPDDVTIAKEAYERARKANNGLIHRQAARLYDAVHRDLRMAFPAPTDAKSLPAKPGYVAVRSYVRAPSKSKTAESSPPLGGA